MKYSKDVIVSLAAPFRDAVEIHRLRFGVPGTGKHIAIVSGLHGNEVGGICAVNQLIATIKASQIVGCIDVYPVINRMGLDDSSKINPLDHRDINRWFPGHSEGSASERIANAVFASLEPCDAVVSVHTGAEHIFDIVQVRCLSEDVEMYKTLGAPLVWVRPEVDGRVSLLGQCRSRGQSIMYLTGGRGNSLDLDSVAMMRSVLLSWLRTLGVVSDVFLPSENSLTLVGSMTEIRSNYGGLFIPSVNIECTGVRVKKGQILVTVQHVVGGEILEVMEAPFDALVTSVRVNPVAYPHELILRLIPLIS